MKILQVITSLQIGGAEKLIVDIVPMLRQRGLDVDVCLFNGKDTSFKQQLQTCGCKIYDLSYDESYYSPLKIFKLWRIMRHYDIVHTHNTAPQVFAAIASVFCSVVLITTEHNTSNRRRDWKWYPVSIDRWMYNQYRKIICISNQAEINLKESIGKCRADIDTIFNGIDLERFHLAKPDIALRNASKRFVIIMVAGFRFQKDQDTLIKAMSHLDKDKFELWLVGDGERRVDLESMVVSLDLSEQVRFWGIRSDIPELLHTADVVVMSSHFEGLSLSNIEGMSVGKPFVASDVDGLREITKGYGILFPHGDDQALADEINNLAEDSSLYNQIADQCYNRAQQFDIKKMVDSYKIIYQKELNDKCIDACI